MNYPIYHHHLLLLESQYGTWGDFIQAEAHDNGVRKTAGTTAWDSTAVTDEIAYSDAGIRMVLNSELFDRGVMLQIMISTATNGSNFHIAGQDTFAAQVAPSSIKAYYKSSAKGDVGVWQNGDILEVRKVFETVEVRINSATIYTFPETASPSFKGRIAMNRANVEVPNVELVGAWS